MEQSDIILQLKQEIKRYINANKATHILIHSDVLFGLKVKFESQSQFLDQHISELLDICYPMDIIMPSFNYDFCKGKPYNIKTDSSQVGTLSEHFRLNYSKWRTSTPVFNFSGTGNNVSNTKYNTDPFDEESVFGFLTKNNALLMHYGSGFNSTTLIHYVERISGQLVYRFDKQFSGKVIDNDNQEFSCDLKYHVRPLNYKMEYDWQKLEQELINSNIIKKFKEGRTQIIIGNISNIVDFWLKKLNYDRFYFLEEETRLWVVEKYNLLARQFLQTDFE
jgi:aminoglycoside 3-N-acetyltransferase